MRLSSCYQQTVNLNENAAFQSVMNTVVSSIIVIRMIEILTAGCGGLGPMDAWLKSCGTVGFLMSFGWLARENGDTLKSIKR